MKSPVVSSRRHFLHSGSLALAGSTLSLITTRKSARAGESGSVIGEGEHRYEVLHGWAQLPDKFTWQTTHNVAVDKARNLYVIHEGKEEQKDHPAIFVFDQDGKFVRAFGNQFQGGGHGLEVREEDGQVQADEVRSFDAFRDSQTSHVWHRTVGSDELYTFDSGTIELHPTDSGSYATLESQWTEYRGDWSRYSEPMSPLAPPNA